MSVLNEYRRKKILEFIIAPIFWIFIGMIIGSLFENPIDNFIDEKIKGKKEFITITLSHNVPVDNHKFVDFSSPEKEEYSFEGKDEKRNYSLYIFPKKRDYSLYEDGNKVITEGYFILPLKMAKNDGTITQNCLIPFIKNFGLVPKEERESVLPVESTINESKNIFMAVNTGTKPVYNFKTTFCLNTQISRADGDTTNKQDKCMELRSENLLPGDELRGTFDVFEKYEIERITGWDENVGDYPPNRFFESIIILIPNCTP